MATNNTLTIQITRATRLPTRATFGTTLLAAFHDLPGPLTRTYASIEDVEADFDPTLEKYFAINRMANAAFKQNPRPAVLKVGKRTTAYTQIFEIAPKAVQGEGFVWSFTIDGAVASYTEVGADTIDGIVDGLVAAANLLTPSMTAAPDGDPATFLTLTADNPGEAHEVIVDLNYFDFDDTTTDPGIAADLSAIRGVDEEWYTFVLDSQSPAEVAAASAWAESRTVFFGADVYTDDVVDPLATTDVASVLLTAQRSRSMLFWARPGLPQLAGAGVYRALEAISQYFASFPPGEATFKFKQPVAISSGTLPTQIQATLEAKSVNHIEEKAGLSRTYEGTVSKGSGTVKEFADLVILTDVIQARIGEDVDALFVLEDKVPYTAEGLESIAATIRGALNAFVPAGIVAGTPNVIVPIVDGIPAAERAERLLDGVSFSAQFTNAVHSVTIRGTLEI